jgi:hypothetical protein
MNCPYCAQDLGERRGIVDCNGCGQPVNLSAMAEHGNEEPPRESMERMRRLLERKCGIRIDIARRIYGAAEFSALRRGEVQ